MLLIIILKKNYVINSHCAILIFVITIVLIIISVCYCKISFSALLFLFLYYLVLRKSIKVIYKIRKVEHYDSEMWCENNNGFPGGEKPFCEECGRIYSSMSNLRQHIANVHAPGTWVQCNICGKYFKTRQYLYNHLLQTHGIRQRTIKNFY